MEDDYEPTPEEMKRMNAISEREEREVDEFFVFPDWFPQPSKISYQILLSYLLYQFRHRWPKDFQPRMLRQGINTAKEYYADPTNPDAGNIDMSTFPTGFQPPDTPLIYELARVEHGAGLPPLEGLEFIADKNAVRGYQSATAHKLRDDYQDKQDCQKRAQNLWRANPNLTIKQLQKCPELNGYARKYKGRTLQHWLSEIDPRPPEKRRGPKSHK